MKYLLKFFGLAALNLAHLIDLISCKWKEGRFKDTNYHNFPWPIRDNELYEHGILGSIASSINATQFESLNPLKI